MGRHPAAVQPNLANYRPALTRTFDQQKHGSIR